MLNLTPKKRVLKNFSSIVLTYVLLFACANSNSSVQPIFNQEKNLGTTSKFFKCLKYSNFFNLNNFVIRGQMLLFISQTLTTLVLPLVICETIGFKYSLILAQLLHLCCIYFIKIY